MLIGLVLRKIRNLFIVFATGVGLPIWGVIMFWLGWREPYFVVIFGLYWVAIFSFVYDKIRDKGLHWFAEEILAVIFAIIVYLFPPTTVLALLGLKWFWNIPDVIPISAIIGAVLFFVGVRKGKPQKSYDIILTMAGIILLVVGLSLLVAFISNI